MLLYSRNTILYIKQNIFHVWDDALHLYIVPLRPPTVGCTNSGNNRYSGSFHFAVGR